jgi:hypothetical protein
MAIQVQLRRGTTAQNNAFTGAVGEVTVDTDKDTAVVHDGATAGGFPLVGEKGTQTITGVKTFANGLATDTISEETSAAGVTIDGVLLKDSGVVTGAGTVSAPAITTTGDTNTGIFFPAADTIAFAEGGAEAMRINSSGDLLIGTTSNVSGDYRTVVSDSSSELLALNATGATLAQLAFGNTTAGFGATKLIANGNDLAFIVGAAERMRINSSGNVGIGTTSPVCKFDFGTSAGVSGTVGLPSFALYGESGASAQRYGFNVSANALDISALGASATIKFYTGGDVGSITERARITSGGAFCVGKTSTDFNTAGFHAVGAGATTGETIVVGNAITPFYINRLANDGGLIAFYQAGTEEGTISVSGNTVSYNAFCGGHWTQLQEGRGYNPDIPRGTVMSSIGEMAVWKSVEWAETIEHPAIEAVEAVEAVLDEDGNVIEPAVEAVEGKEAWTESIPHRESYLGNLNIGETFEEDGFTKTVVDDGNERLPKVKISDVVGDKAVYGVFQTWDEVEDMLISSLGAFVVRVALGVTVEVGDLLESNGDGCAKVQDDDIIRSKTIGKVTSTVATDTYDDGSYTVPCVLYCG